MHFYTPFEPIEDQGGLYPRLGAEDSAVDLFHPLGPTQAFESGITDWRERDPVHAAARMRDKDVRWYKPFSGDAGGAADGILPHAFERKKGRVRKGGSDASEPNGPTKRPRRSGSEGLIEGAGAAANGDNSISALLQAATAIDVGAIQARPYAAVQEGTDDDDDEEMEEITATSVDID